MPLHSTDIKDINHKTEPILLSSEQIVQFNEEGRRWNNQTIRMVDECRDALSRMPSGHQGIVLGSGPNTPDWHKRGWETCELLNQYKPTYAGEANNLAEMVADKLGMYDYICSEYISMNATAGKPAAVLNVYTHQISHYEPALGAEKC